MLRTCGYIGAVALLGVVATQFLDIAEVSAGIEPAARPQWNAVEQAARPFVIDGDWAEGPTRPGLRPSVAAR